MKRVEKNLIIPSIVIIIQSVLLFAIFYILSSDQEISQNQENTLFIAAGFMIIGGYITFRSLSKLKKDEKEESFVKQTTY
jgi:hydrogenase-4 membrane subunit HyfE